MGPLAWRGFAAFPTVGISRLWRVRIQIDEHEKRIDRIVVIQLRLQIAEWAHSRAWVAQADVTVYRRVGGLQPVVEVFRVVAGPAVAAHDRALAQLAMQGRAQLGDGGGPVYGAVFPTVGIVRLGSRRYL